MGWRNLLWRERLMVNDHEEGVRHAGWIKPKKSLVTVCKKRHGLQEASLAAQDRAGWRNTIRAIET